MTLEQRVKNMASRWNYQPDELEQALQLAKKDPEGWEKMCEHDEKHGLGLLESLKKHNIPAT